MTLPIDILYVPDCTGWQPTARLIEEVLADLGLEGTISFWEVASDRQAIEWGFVGSPTIRIHGEDLFPLAVAPAGKRLRPYFTPDGEMVDHPTYEMLVEALRPYAG